MNITPPEPYAHPAASTHGPAQCAASHADANGGAASGIDHVTPVTSDAARCRNLSEAVKMKIKAARAQGLLPHRIAADIRLDLNVSHNEASSLIASYFRLCDTERMLPVGRNLPADMRQRIDELAKLGLGSRAIASDINKDDTYSHSISPGRVEYYLQTRKPWIADSDDLPGLMRSKIDTHRAEGHNAKDIARLINEDPEFDVRIAPHRVSMHFQACDRERALPAKVPLPIDMRLRIDQLAAQGLRKTAIASTMNQDRRHAFSITPGRVDYYLRNRSYECHPEKSLIARISDLPSEMRVEIDAKKAQGKGTLATSNEINENPKFRYLVSKKQLDQYWKSSVRRRNSNERHELAPSRKRRRVDHLNAPSGVGRDELSLPDLELPDFDEAAAMTRPGSPHIALPDFDGVQRLGRVTPPQHGIFDFELPVFEGVQDVTFAWPDDEPVGVPSSRHLGPI